VNIPSSIWTLLIGIVLTLTSLWYGQNHGLLPIAASDEATLVDGLFNTMMTISTGLFVLVQGVLIYAAFKFRRRQGDNTDAPPVFGNIPLEILWTAIPAIIVIGLSIYSFDVYNEIGGFDPHGAHEAPIAGQAMKMPGAAIAQRAGTAIAATLNDTPPSTEPNANQIKSDEAMSDPATASVRNSDQVPQKRDAPGIGIVSPGIGASPDNVGKVPGLAVNVTGLQYAWIFTYPDTSVVASELHVPAGKEVMLDMTANDVIHAFWVPELRLKQDVIPGRQSEIRFTPQVVGEYKVICAELCGPYHGAMNTKFIVETPENFDKWLQEQQVATKTDLEQAIALNAADRSPAEFLSPYTAQMGIQPETLHQLHHH